MRRREVLRINRGNWIKYRPIGSNIERYASVDSMKVGKANCTFGDIVVHAIDTEDGRDVFLFPSEIIDKIDPRSEVCK